METKFCLIGEGSQSAQISPLSEENESPIVMSPSSKINSNNSLNSDTSMRDKYHPKSKSPPTIIEELSNPNGNTRRQALQNQHHKLNKQSPKNRSSKSCTMTPDSRNCEPRSSFHPVTITLNFLDSLGVFVESVVSTACGHIFNDFDDDNTINTYEREQLLDGIEKFERLNSFDTFGTMNTMETMNTLTTVQTNDSASTMGTNTVASCTVDDDGNVIPAGVIKEHLTRKQIADKLIESSSAQKSKISSPLSQLLSETNTEKSSQSKKKRRRKKKKRRKKVVGFEYPPISKVRQVPRVSSTERKKLFFDEDEIEYDSNSESDYDSSEGEMQIAMTPKTSISATENKNVKTTSALRKGKYASDIQKPPTKAPVIVNDHSEQQSPIEAKSAGAVNRDEGQDETNHLTWLLTTFRRHGH